MNLNPKVILLFIAAGLTVASAAGSVKAVQWAAGGQWLEAGFMGVMVVLCWQPIYKDYVAK